MKAGSPLNYLNAVKVKEGSNVLLFCGGNQQAPYQLSLSDEEENIIDDIQLVNACYGVKNLTSDFLL